MTFRTSDNSGDAALEAEASSAGELFADIALGLYSLSCSPKDLRPGTVKTLSLSADSPESLLVNFINELVYLMDTEGFVASEAEAGFSPGEPCRLEAVLRGETAAFERHQRGLLVKAATYHGILFSADAGRWRARVVLDL